MQSVPAVLPESACRAYAEEFTDRRRSPVLRSAAGRVIAGWAYLRLGRFAEAEKASRRALEISPTYESAHYYLGVVLLTEGKAEEALA